MDAALLPALYDALMVARTGSVALAAKRLNKTPSAVSQQIRRLGDAFGVALFERRGRGLVLTPEAAQLLPSLTRLFDQAEAVFRLFDELGGQGSTTLRLATSDYLATPLLVPVLRALSERGLRLKLEISTAHSEQAIGLLERGEVEVAVVSFRGSRQGLSAKVLFEQSFHWVGPRGSGRRRSLADELSTEPLLRLAAGSLGRRLLDDYLLERGIRAASTIDVPSVSLLLAYASGGVGIGLAPALALVDADRQRIAVERAEIAALPVQVLTRHGRAPDAPATVFHELLMAQARVLRPRLKQR